MCLNQMSVAEVILCQLKALPSKDCFPSPGIQPPCYEEAPPEWDEPTYRKSTPGKGWEPDTSVNSQHQEPKCESEVVWISQTRLTTQHNEWPLTNTTQSRRTAQLVQVVHGSMGNNCSLLCKAIPFWCGLLCSNGSQNGQSLLEKLKLQSLWFSAGLV